MIKKKEQFVRFKEVSCPALNVRANPSTKALITKIIPMNTVVECDKNFVDDEWDHIITDPNIEGYCMKRYLKPLDPDTRAAFGGSPIIIHSLSKNLTSDSIDEEKKDDIEEKED